MIDSCIYFCIFVLFLDYDKAKQPNNMSFLIKPANIPLKTTSTFIKKPFFYK